MSLIAHSTINTAYIFLSTMEAYHRIPIVDIVYCSSFNSYTEFHTIDNRTIIASQSIAYYTKLLSQFNFIRIHQSTLLNLSYLSSIGKGQDNGSVQLTTGGKLIISRAKKAEVINHLKKMSIDATANT